MINSPKPEFGLLSGLRVIMIGLSVAAPFAGELYAEHGADVIWIENPKAVDSARVARKGGSWQQDRGLPPAHLHHRRAHRGLSGRQL